jgi:hypothetical protein
MKPRSAHKILREQLPERYYTLIQKYLRKNNNCSNLADAIRLSIPWHPNATDEGYKFWEQVYYWAVDQRVNLPKVIQFGSPDTSFAYDNRYELCKRKAIQAIDVVTDLFGEIGLDRQLPNVYKRYIIFNYLLNSRLDLYSLQMIGEVVAHLIGRKEKFDHATIIHARRNESQLTETREPLYCQMLQAFNQRIEAMELEKVA